MSRTPRLTDLLARGILAVLSFQWAFDPASGVEVPMWLAVAGGVGWSAQFIHGIFERLSQ